MFRIMQKWNAVKDLFVSLFRCFVIVKVNPEEYFSRNSLPLQELFTYLFLGSRTEAILTIFVRFHILLNPFSELRNSCELGIGFAFELRLIITNMRMLADNWDIWKFSYDYLPARAETPISICWSFCR